MEEIQYRTLKVNGLKMHVAEQGSGPLVLLLHGFPAFWFSWRHQIPVIAKAGYHVVAPDMRGYGQTDAPEDPTMYTGLNIAGDVVGLINALGEKQAYIVGHDWGAIVAWYTAVFRPDLVKCLVTLSLGLVPRRPDSSLLDTLRASFGDEVYMAQWQEPGKAESDFARDIKLAIEKIYSNRVPKICMATDTKTVLENLLAPDTLPHWITPEEIQVYVDTFSKTGFTPALNWYRNIQRTWDQMAPWTGKGTPVPGLVITGDLDLIIDFTRPYLESPSFKNDCPNAEYKILQGYGHFIHEEAPEIINSHILEYLKKH